MTDSTQAAAAQDTTAAPAGDVQSDSTVLTSTTEAAAPQTTEATSTEAAQPDQQQPVIADFTDFTIADGVQMDADVLNDFKGLAKEFGLTQEGAQKLIDLQTALVAKQEQQYQAQLAEQAQQWQASLKSDKDFGGDRYDQSVQTAVKAVEQFGSPELRQLLNDSGLGNHPELVKFCHRIGKALSEDSLVLGGTQQSRESDPAKRLFPNMN